MKLTVGAMRAAFRGLPDDVPVVIAENGPVGQTLPPISEVEQIDGALNYSWDGEDLDESGMAGEPAVVIWWKDES